MNFRLISAAVRTARKPHRCIWCGEGINTGQTYTYERSVFGGEMQHHHFHTECLDSMHDAAREEGGEIEFTPYDQERPRGGA